MNKIVITYPRKRRVRKRKQEQCSDNSAKRLKRVCQFCLSEEDNEVNFGTIYEKEDVTVHYFCMLLSSGLCQNARVSDKKSILGFLVSDIKKELNRGARLKCCFCHGKGATIGCCVKTCRRVFHLSCGRENGTMHQFFDSFRSYCGSHRLEQELPKNLSHHRSPKKKLCSICLCDVTSFASCDSLFVPCCQKSWFHRVCIQQYALSAGMHYFKCPLCNSVEEFQEDMFKFGIYIPDQDASWEREPNAFLELLERHNSCDVPECLCPEGRLFDADSGQLELLLCGWCGAFGSHRVCKGLVRKGIHLVCCDCAEIIDKADKSLQNVSNEVKAECKQDDLLFVRSRQRHSSLHQQGPSDEHLFTSSVRTNPRRRGRPPKQQSSETPHRKTRCAANLQDQLCIRRKAGRPRGSGTKKQYHRARCGRRREGIPRQEPGPSEEMLDRASAEEREKPLTNQETGGLKFSEQAADDKENRELMPGENCKDDMRNSPLFDCRVVLRRVDADIRFKIRGNYSLHLPFHVFKLNDNCPVEPQSDENEQTEDVHCYNNLRSSDLGGIAGNLASLEVTERIQDSTIHKVCIGDSPADIISESDDVLGTKSKSQSFETLMALDAEGCGEPQKHGTRNWESVEDVKSEKLIDSYTIEGQKVDTEIHYEQISQTSSTRPIAAHKVTHEQSFSISRSELLVKANIFHENLIADIEKLTDTKALCEQILPLPNTEKILLAEKPQEQIVEPSSIGQINAEINDEQMIHLFDKLNYLDQENLQSVSLKSARSGSQTMNECREVDAVISQEPALSDERKALLWPKEPCGTIQASRIITSCVDEPDVDGSPLSSTYLHSLPFSSETGNDGVAENKYSSMKEEISRQVSVKGHGKDSFRDRVTKCNRMLLSCANSIKTQKKSKDSPAFQRFSQSKISTFFLPPSKVMKQNNHKQS